MGKLNIVLPAMVCLILWLFLPGFCAEIKDYSNDPAFGGYPVDPEYYKALVRDCVIPTRPEMSDMELAQKLNLDSAELSEVKKAVKENDAAKLRAALAGYLNMRLSPSHVTVTGKPAPNAGSADKWLKDEIAFGEKTYQLGERMNWFAGCKDYMEQIVGWYFGPPLAEAYIATGDPKYAQVFLTLARSFYHTAGRPPARRPVTWFGCGGPWRPKIFHERIQYMLMCYRTFGASDLVTDADRVMFLKMFYEHGDRLYQVSERPQIQNFGFAILPLVDLSVAFPEIRDSALWLERCNVRFGEMARDMLLEDGGSMERTGYGPGVVSGLMSFYRKLRNAGVVLPEPVKDKLEKGFEYVMWFVTPTYLYPMFGHGTPNDLFGYLENWSELFPEREDFLYSASRGKKGHPPSRTARDLWHMGYTMMRSDWSRDALYMGVNYNGSPHGIDHHPELLSFAVQAHGRLYMTNSGTTENYGFPQEANWNEQTISANTVIVDHECQETVDNGGQLENWESMPGFDYLAGVSRGYEHVGVRHRRAVLFMKPFFRSQLRHGYWLIYDRLDGDGSPHEYRWLGHFQPAELKVDAFRKIVETADDDGKRLYLISAEPYSHFGLEQDSGPLQSKNGVANGPYISLVRQSAGPVAFKVMLYPATKDDKAPVLESLPARDGDRPTGEMPHQAACSPRKTEEAVCFRVTQGELEDFLAIAQSPALRTYGRWGTVLLTDGETAFIRRDNGQILETGLVRGQRLNFGGEPLIEVSPQVASINVKYVGDKVEIHTHGTGKLRVGKLQAKEAILNGKPVQFRVTDGLMNIEPSYVKPVILTAPVFSTDPSKLCRAVGVPYGPEVGPNTWGSYNKAPEDSILLTWQSSAPADAEVEYRSTKEKTWKRSVHGELLTYHRFVISEIEPGKTYEFRITCHSEEGASVTSRMTYKGRFSK